VSINVGQLQELAGVNTGGRTIISIASFKPITQEIDRKRIFILNCQHANRRACIASETSQLKLMVF